MTDIAYERKINDLIPQAEREANKKLKNLIEKFEIRIGNGGRKYRHCFRSEFFHKAMNKLAFTSGLRSWC